MSRLSELLQVHPVVITGAGAITAAGPTAGALWECAVQGRPTAERVAAYGGHAACAVAGPLDLASGGAALHKADRVCQLAVVAATEAWTAAGLHLAAPDPERIGIVCGTTRGPLQKWTESQTRLPAGRLRPSLAASSTLASLSGSLSLRFHTHGPAFTVAAACASSAVAIAQAAEQIALGQVEVALAGGAEAPLLPVVFAQLEAAGILGTHADPGLTCRPFDRDRNGTVLGEGAGFLVLESADSARRRGRPVLARLAGWGVTSEGAQRTGIGAGGGALVRAMRLALGIAGLPPDAIDYVNAHGTGTVLNDREEAAALRQVFGARTAQLPCSATKPITGHCMGAASAIEAILCLAALREQCVPPTAAWANADPECPLDLVPGHARPARLQHVMSNSSGFWGNNASLIFSAP